MRSLTVYLEQQVIGILSEGNGIWSFRYTQEWVTSAGSFDLSPALPRSQIEHQDGGTVRPVQWYFDNLLPEEELRKAVAKEGKVRDADDSFALLEYLGAESAGSLTLLPPDVLPAQRFEMQPLSDAELSLRIANLPKATLSKQAPKRMSVAGAQHKLLVVMRGDDLYEPVGAMPSSHILKPDHPKKATYPASTFNEYLTMRLARAARLRTPQVFLRYVPEPVYVIERFDRLVTRPRVSANGLPFAVKRLHVIDACQLLNKDRVFKHSGATLESLADIVDRTTNKIASRQALYRWLVFNVMVGNDDSHLKNLSFFVTHQGVSVAEHYDLLSTGAYHTATFADEDGHWPNVPMTFELPGARTFAQVSRDALLAAGAELGLPRTMANRIVSEVLERVPKAFGALKSEHDATWDGAPPERAQTIALQRRLASVIEHVILKDMRARLQ